MPTTDEPEALTDPADANRAVSDPPAPVDADADAGHDEDHHVDSLGELLAEDARLVAHHEPALPPHDLGPVARFDDAVDRAFDRFRGREPSDRVVYAVSELADFSLLWHLVGWSKALAGSDEDLEAAVRLSALLAIESVIVNVGIKSLFKRERPVYQGERPHPLRVPLTTSFPSGHASAAVVSAILLSDRTKAAPLYWGLAGFVAASRVHVRIHHASDVLGGAVVGAGIGLALRKIWPHPRRRR